MINNYYEGIITKYLINKYVIRWHDEFLVGVMCCTNILTPVTY